jgi:thioredoxin reductase (NADPH)
VVVKNIFGVILSAILPVLPMASVEPPAPEPIVILGGGIGSLTSAIYMGRAGISPLVIEGAMPGGLLTQSHSVQNWPGELEITGTDLTEKIRKQAEANGARFLNEEVVSVDFSKRPFTITTRALDGSGKTHRIVAESCIIATGSTPNYLGIPGEQEYWGHGVTNCAICDGSLYKDKVVGVVGGGDAAVVEALYLSNIAKKVHIFVRRDVLRAGEEKRVALLKEKPNVQFHFNTTVEEVKGREDKVAAVVLKTQSQKRVEMPLDGLFLAIGSQPNSALFQKQLEIDGQGYIVLNKDQETKIQGVYAIGDVADKRKQAITAAGAGATAALQAQQYLSDRENHLVKREEVAPKEEVVIHHKVIDISSVEQFNDEVQNSTIPVFVDFYATWCGPCKRISPLIDSSAAELAGKVKFLKVNVDKLSGLSTEYNVTAMPTMLRLDDSGSEVERKVGPDQISDMLHKLKAPQEIDG